MRNCQISQSIPNNGYKELRLSYPRKKDRPNLINFRPATLINISYKIWAVIIRNRLTPNMNLLRKENQDPYKKGRSTIDILSITQNRIQNEKIAQLTLTDLSKAFKPIGRNILRTVLYEKGIAWDLYNT